MQIIRPAVAISPLLAHSHQSSRATMSLSGTSNGIAMILSPAKTLDLTPLSERSFADSTVKVDDIKKLSREHALTLCDASKTDVIVKTMKGKSESELTSLLQLSPTLAKSSHEYWSAFEVKTRSSSNCFSVFAFSGPAFQQGIVPQTCNLSTLAYIAKNLYILDPVYGVLRGLDQMQPYRLEMGCKGITSAKKETLATYWRDSITATLGHQLSISLEKESPPILVNLASEEYSSSVDISSLPANTMFVNVIFRHQGRIIAVHAKRARGLMVRYISENNAKSLADISNFKSEGYRCATDGNEKWKIKSVVGDNVRVTEIVFDRDGAPSSTQSKAKRKDGSKSASRKKQK